MKELYSWEISKSKAAQQNPQTTTLTPTKPSIHKTHEKSCNLKSGPQMPLHLLQGEYLGHPVCQSENCLSLVECSCWINRPYLCKSNPNNPQKSTRKLPLTVYPWVVICNTMLELIRKIKKFQPILEKDQTLGEIFWAPNSWLSGSPPTSLRIWYTRSSTPNALTETMWVILDKKLCTNMITEKKDKGQGH